MSEFPELRSVIEALVTGLGPDLKAVVLFGSRSRGDAAITSDYDILIVADSMPTEPIARLRRIRIALANILLPVNTVAKTPEELDRHLTPLLLEICVDGKCLYGEEFFEPRRSKALAALAASGLKRKWRGRSWSWAFDRPMNCDWELEWGGFREFAR